MHATGGLNLLIFHCLPELNNQKHMSEQLCRDLENRGLIAQGTKLTVAMTLAGVLAPRTTELAKQFPTFIS